MPLIHINQLRKRPIFKDLETIGHEILHDWYGRPLESPVRFLFAVFEDRFHFLIESTIGSGMSHPDSRNSVYQAELWKFDVAEFFLSDPTSGNYLEFNLSPNGAWWSCGFSGVLKPAAGEPSPIPDVETHSEENEASWKAHASLPLDWLKEHYHFGPSSRLNATFILASPEQIFLTAGPAARGNPDFHRPDAFPPVDFISLA